MGKSDNTVNEQVTVSKPIKRKIRVPGNRVIVIGGVSLLIFVVFFGLLIVRQNYTKKKPKLMTQADFSRVDPVAQNLNDVENTAKVQGINAAKKSIDKLINKEKNMQQKASYMEAKANICAAYKDYLCTLDSNDRSLKITGDDASVLLISGDAAYKLNQKTKGNSYYSRAIVALQKNKTSKSQKLTEQIQAIMAGKPMIGDTE